VLEVKQLTKVSRWFIYTIARPTYNSHATQNKYIDKIQRVPSN